MGMRAFDAGAIAGVEEGRDFGGLLVAARAGEEVEFMTIILWDSSEAVRAMKERTMSGRDPKAEEILSGLTSGRRQLRCGAA